MSGSLADKLIARSVIDGSCRRWTGARGGRGYGQIWVGGGKSALVHRVAYELWVGPIPDGYTIDHVFERGCVHRDCFEPAHLEAVTVAENNRRGHAARAVRWERAGHWVTGPRVADRQAAEVLDR